MKSKKKRALIAIMALIGSCIFFLCIFSMYSKAVSHGIELDTKTYINEITKQTSQKIDTIIKNEFEKIENMANLFENDEQLSEDEFVKTFNKYLRHGYKDIGLIDLSGQGITTSREKVNYKNQPFFQQALKGQTTLSMLDKDDNCDTPIYIYATPIYKENIISGILYGGVSIEDLFKDTNYEFFNSLGDLYLINNNHKDVIKQRLNSNHKPKSLSEQIDINAINNKAKKEILHSLSMNKSGVTVARNYQNHSTYYVGYSPLKSQGWYVVSVINGNEMKMESKKIKTNTLLFFSILMTLMIGFAAFLLIVYEKAKERIKKTKIELETVIENIPGGVVRFSYDDCLSIQFLNDGLLKLTGYTKFDIKSKLENRFLNLVHEQDREELASAIVDQMTTNKTVEINCRLKCCDGKYSWFLFKGRMITSDSGSQTCLCVLTDINETKQAQQELNLSVQRYHIITEQSDSIIFEYSFLDNSIYLSDKWYKKFAPVNLDKGIYNYLANSKLIEPSDFSVFEQMRDSVKNGTLYNEFEIRLQTMSSKYIWCRVKMSSILDENHNICKIIGKIVDIDVQKRETESLKKKAEIDSLSGLYNKGTTQMLINNYLATNGASGKHALLILDIDNFKSINDNLGHLVGDTVIRNITTRMKDIVRASDICGRVGGDEFVVLLKNVKSNDIVKAKASEICSAFRHTICNDSKTLNISCSIGISFYDEHGATYNELIDKADTALYEAKKRGKDQLVIYGTEIE